jgi:hypothetical protein
MSVLRSPDEIVRFQPRPDGPTYLLRVPTVYDRPAWRKEIRRMGGRVWTATELATTLRAGIDAVLKRDDETDEEREERERWLGYVDEYKAGLQAAIERWQAEKSDEADQEWRQALKMRPELEVIADQSAAEYQPYSDRVSDNESFREVSGMAAFKLFARGWEGENLPPFRRAHDGPDPSLMRRVPFGDYMAISGEVDRLMSPQEEQAKNSDSESGASQNQTPSDS